jgi:dimethylhistidine N-methyltransferase
VLPRAESEIPSQGIVRIYRLLDPGADGFLSDVLAGLSLPQKAIPPKYFYDERGSQLFEQICGLDEYYPTRTELAIMRECIDDLAKLLGPDTELVEFGSGASVKTRILIERVRPSLYMPVDIAEVALREAAGGLAGLFPWLNVSGLVADFAQPLALPEFVGLPVRRRVVYFPGSTIGNFTPDEALAFLRRVHGILGAGGVLVIGVDTKKSKKVLDAAYDDARGVTAEFNLNLLRRINRELGGDFQVARFRHKAFYAETAGRIEMHLESTHAQFVRIAGRRFDFAPGETIHTEISCKYAIDEFRALGDAARFHTQAVYTDPERLFAVFAMMAV